jgi:hypothetical protein
MSEVLQQPEQTDEPQGSRRLLHVAFLGLTALDLGKISTATNWASAFALNRFAQPMAQFVEQSSGVELGTSVIGPVAAGVGFAAATYFKNFTTGIVSGLELRNNPGAIKLFERRLPRIVVIMEKLGTTSDTGPRETAFKEYLGVSRAIGSSFGSVVPHVLRKPDMSTGEIVRVSNRASRRQAITNGFLATGAFAAAEATGQDPQELLGTITHHIMTYGAYALAIAGVALTVKNVAGRVVDQLGSAKDTLETSDSESYVLKPYPSDNHIFEGLGVGNTSEFN